VLSDRYPVCHGCLSVTLVYCGQVVGWIKIKLGTEVGLGPGHSELDVDPAPPPCLLWIHQDATSYGGRPRPRRHCVRWSPAPPPVEGAQPPPKKSAHVRCGQTAGWIKMLLDMEVGLASGEFVLDGDPAPTKRGTVAPPLFSAHVYCGQTVARLSCAIFVTCHRIFCFTIQYYFIKKAVKTP